MNQTETYQPLKVTVSHLGTGRIQRISLPMSDEELQNFIASFNPEDTCIETHDLNLTDIDTYKLTHRSALKHLYFLNLETLNKAARMLVKSPDFLLLVAACDTAEEAMNVFSQEEKCYHIYFDIESKEQLGWKLAEEMGVFKSIENAETLERYFDYERFAEDEIINRLLAKVDHHYVQIHHHMINEA